MLSSLVEPGPTSIVPASLSGARVVLTGLRPSSGALLSVLARAGARVFAQTPGRFPAIDGVVSRLTRDGADIAVTKTPLSPTAAVRFAQNGARALGGIDHVVNVITFSGKERSAAAASDDIDEAIHDLLLPACLVTRVGANRMRMTRGDGTIVNIFMDSPASGREAAFQGCARAALKAMTRMEAREWASAGVGVAAVVASKTAPRTADRVARLALHLLGGAGRRVSGLTLDAGAAEPRCLDEVCALF